MFYSGIDQHNGVGGALPGNIKDPATLSLRRRGIVTVPNSHPGANRDSPPSSTVDRLPRIYSRYGGFHGPDRKNALPQHMISCGDSDSPRYEQGPALTED